MPSLVGSEMCIRDSRKCFPTFPRKRICRSTAAEKVVCGRADTEKVMRSRKSCTGGFFTRACVCCVPPTSTTPHPFKGGGRGEARRNSHLRNRNRNRGRRTNDSTNRRCFPTFARKRICRSTAADRVVCGRSDIEKVIRLKKSCTGGVFTRACVCVLCPPHPPHPPHTLSRGGGRDAIAICVIAIAIGVVPKYWST